MLFVFLLPLMLLNKDYQRSLSEGSFVQNGVVQILKFDGKPNPNPNHNRNRNPNPDS